MSDFQRLWEEYQKIDFESSGMARNEHYLSGLGFFPGGRGLWEKGDEKIAGKPIMVLGQDFGTVEYFTSLKSGTESDRQPTWRNLLILLNNAGVMPGNCFFTNAFLGLREQEQMVGDTPAWKNKHFLIACQNFFLLQYSLQKPRLILVLGKNPAYFLSHISDDLTGWKKFTSISSLDGLGFSAQKNIRFNDYPQHSSNLFLLTHPSYRHLNGLKRKIHFNGRFFEGSDAEPDLIKQLII